MATSTMMADPVQQSSTTTTTNQNLRALLLTKSSFLPRPGHANKSNNSNRHVTQAQRSRVNYERRSNQYARCGYKSPISKPYQELGDVILDNNQLILKGLGQEGGKLETEDSSCDEEEFNLNIVEDEKEEQESHTKTDLNKLRTIDEQLKQGLKVLKKVRLGRSLFDLIENERLEKERMRALKKAKEERERRSKMIKPNNNNNNGPESSDDECDELSTILISSSSPSRRGSAIYPHNRTSLTPTINNKNAWSETSNNNKKGNFLTVTDATLSSTRIPSGYLLRRGSHQFSAHGNHRGGSGGGVSRAPKTPKKKKKKKSEMMRPFSPIYTNLNSCQVENRDSLFRQLCVVNWILEAMSQDNNPPVMSPITSSWNIRDLRQESKLLQKRVEKYHVIEPIWQSFLSNPSLSNSSRFQFRLRRKSTRFVQTSRRSSIQSGLLKIDDVTESSSKPLIQRSPSLADIVTMAKQQQQHKAELEINSPHLGQLTASMKANFDDIRTEQAIILHDNLELQERNRWSGFEKKFSTLKVMTNLHEALKTLRHNNNNGSATTVDETADQSEEDGITEEQKKTVEMCQWYLSLVLNLADDLKNEKNFVLILKKLQRFCDLEGRKTSVSHFIRTLSILRPFELCHPDISAAVEFVRDKIVSMERKDYEMWCKKHTKQRQQIHHHQKSISFTNK